MKKGVKRFCLSLMLIAVPFVSAEPVSLLQETPVFQPPALPPTLRQTPKPEKQRPSYYGKASWYSETDAGIHRHTANGEVFDDSQLTCASWHFPFGTRLHITNLQNGQSIVCRVNDRGPAKRLHRLIDLTRSAFSEIASLKHGLIQVRVVQI